MAGIHVHVSHLRRVCTHPEGCSYAHTMLGMSARRGPVTGGVAQSLLVILDHWCVRICGCSAAVVQLLVAGFERCPCGCAHPYEPPGLVLAVRVSTNCPSLGGHPVLSDSGTSDS